MDIGETLRNHPEDGNLPHRGGGRGLWDRPPASHPDVIVVTLTIMLGDQNSGKVPWGRMDGHIIMQSTKCHEPACMLAHGLIDKLSIIVGHCDLLLNEESRSLHPSTPRLRLIRDTAQEMAKELSEHQCRLTLALRETARTPDPRALKNL